MAKQNIGSTISGKGAAMAETFSPEQKAQMEKLARDSARRRIANMYRDASCPEAVEEFERTWRLNYRAMAYP